jgi:putative DNA primase/helicase
MRSRGEDAIRDAVVNAAPAGEEQKGGRRDLRLAKKPLNDIGNSERLEARFGRNLLYVPELGRHYFTGTHWSAKVGPKEWQLAAQKTAGAMWREVLEFEGDPDGPPDPKRLKEQRDFAVDTGNRSRQSAMCALLEPRVEKQVDDLDRDPFLFNVQNGTLELGSKSDPSAVRLRKHSRLDHITRIAPIGFDPDAECPLFRGFLDQIIPDRDVQDWLQRWFGYCLSADYSEHKLAVFWGEGRNGKGVLTKGMQWLLGDYGAVLQFQSFVDAGQRRGGEPTPDLAKLVGTRGVFASEAKSGARLDDGLTGGDPAAVRKLNKEPFDLPPTFKINLICNNKPQIRDTTHGMWSRVYLIPFTVTIPPEAIDPRLLDKLKLEGPGMLNYCLDGFRMWRERGLSAPQAILAATAEYRSESDRIGQFIDTATVPDPVYEIPAAEFFACYEAWCRAMEYKPVSQTLFGKELSKRGIRPEKRGITYRLGRKWNNSAIDWNWQPPYDGEPS